MFGKKVRSSVENALMRTFLLLMLGINFGAFLLARALDINLEKVVTLSAVATLLLVMGLERIFPYLNTWNQHKHDSLVDWSSTAVLLGLVDPILKYLAPLGVVMLYGLVDVSHFYAELFGQTPFWLQLLIVTLLIELSRYWMHRLHHSVAGLWWLHAMHHSSKRLYALNNFRFHPLNYALIFIASILPLMLIGAPAEVLLGYLALSLPVIMLQHANINLRSGVLNYLFSTNELHRWHHSTKASEANCNYGHALVIWDQVFRTFKYHSNGDNTPEEVGLFRSSSRTYPAQASYLTQLGSMFSGKCCKP